ncbi:transferase [Sphingobacterium paramultivorum]|uniref:Transferase n=1 Tax=Sphingobacterium paramultivorum TaxID=2886510 RepID=A0A7G5E9R3_9SPHI|nr:MULTISPECIES: putative sugar nucleotidyl transferase [Sphingobacterium]MCS4167228.1 UDP-N-acetylglucosamine diphosphorylase/glucosamine-1-phosphate N-acetyltransferase [Sphingobacterium sp. BIGb0116]QMV70738.1 transferase [Sphingobacterium paramultivorum]WSO14614.1 putative sugar nucleotidyl transferase [Sphingobacterium paramultivorum]
MKIFFTDCFDSIQLLDKLSSPLTTFDRKSLYPFTFVKSCLDLRVGILTLREKWQKLALEFDVHYITAHSNEEGVIWLSENVIPSVVLLQAIQRLGAGEVLVWGGYVVACCYTHMGSYRVQEFDTSVDLLKGVEDLFLLTGTEITRDFNLLVQGVQSFDISVTNQLLGNDLYVAARVSMECATLNTLQGPIYIDEDVTIMEGAHLRGPLYLGKGAVVKMGATIYGNVSIGKQSVIGGEIGNSVIGDFSAKGHHGYLGCSVIGDWCNLGAGTSNSNLKNNLKAVSIYDYALDGVRDTGLLKCGTFIGDYTRLGINSALNTGTVIGIASMLADTSFYAKFVPSFAWVFDGGAQTYEFDKFMAYLETLYASKGEELSEQIKDKLNQLNKKYN